jgi:hypothetical protein
LGIKSGRKNVAIGDQGAICHISRASARFGFFDEGKVDMNKMAEYVYHLKIGLALTLLLALTGCVGYVDGGGYGGAVVVPGPDVGFYGGVYDRGVDVHAYSHRGFASRATAHGGGGHGGRR